MKYAIFICKTIWSFHNNLLCIIITFVYQMSVCIACFPVPRWDLVEVRRRRRRLSRWMEVNEYDQSMSIVNVHSNTVMYMSTIFVIIVGIVICVYIYVKRGSFCCQAWQQDHQTPSNACDSPAANEGHRVRDSVVSLKSVIGLLFGYFV